MVCPHCGGKLGVIDMVRNTEEVYRRRKCKQCDQFVYTLEKEVEQDAEFRNNWMVCVNNSRTKSRKKEK